MENCQFKSYSLVRIIKIKGFVKLGHSEERAKDMVNEIFTAIYPKVCVSYKLFIAANLDPDEVHTEGRLKLCFDYIDKVSKHITSLARERHRG